jgi:hypothetical protein
MNEIIDVNGAPVQDAAGIEAISREGMMQGDAQLRDAT